jgi:hypothetical protein
MRLRRLARLSAVPLFVVALLLISSRSAMASSSYYTPFTTLYPSSTTGTNAGRCNVCHSSGGGTDLNGFGKDWAARHNAGRTTTQAYQDIEQMNSDGDAAGVKNLDEINANAQPGWTAGQNQLYDQYALTPTGTAPAPAITGGLLDPAATPSNKPPVLTNPGNKTVNEGVLLQFAISATDDGPLTALTFGGSVPTGATLSDNHNGTATFSWTPGFNQGSTTPYPVTITVTDAGGLTASQSFNVTVGNVNRPPTLSPNPVGDKTMNAGQTLTIPFTATDPDGDALTFSGGLPSGATLVPGTNNAATFSWTPAPNQAQAAPYVVTVTVTDPAGLTASQSFNITVGSANRPPTLNPNPVGDRTVNEGQTLTIPFSATDPDGDALTFSTSALPTGATLTPGANNTATFVWTPTFNQGQAAPYAITVTVTDPAGLKAPQSFNITVGNVNRPPTLNPNPVGDRTVTEGQMLTIAFNASDPDGDVLTFSKSALPSGASLVPGATNTASFSWTPTTGQASATPYPITITVTDPGALTATRSFNVTVTASATVNRAPTVNNPGNKTVTAGNPLSFTITGTDPDGNALTFAGTGLPAGATLSPTGTFAWTPTTAQASATPYSVTVSATDNGTPAMTSAPVTFAVTVNAQSPVNRAPTVNNPGNKTVTAGDVLAFTITGTDPDGNALTFAGTGLPAGATLSPTGAFYWSPTTAQVSATPYSVTVTATDNGTPAMKSTPVTFTITVNAPASPTTRSVSIEEAEWEDSRLKVDGRVSRGVLIVSVINADTGEFLGAVRVRRSGEWELEVRRTSAPCRVQAKAGGSASAVTTVKDAPCGAIRRD